MSIELPRYSFNQGARLSEEEVSLFINSLTSSSRQRPTEFSSLVMSLERKRIVDSLIANQVEWIKYRTGLDVQSRVPQTEKINFFTPLVFAEILEREEQPDCSASFVLCTNEIRVKEKDSESQTIFNFHHELIHNFSHQGIWISRGVGEDGSDTLEYSQNLSGYCNTNNDVLREITEVVTNMASVESLDYYRKTTQGVPDYPRKAWMSYSSSVIFFDFLIGEAARLLHTTSQDLMTKVYTGYFGGRVNSLRFLNQAFGPHTLSRLAILGDQSKPTDLKYIAEDFGLDSEDFMDKCWHYEYGGTVEILDGIKIQSPSGVKITRPRNLVHKN